MTSYARHRLEASEADDLRWFKAVLKHKARSNRIPVSQFASVATPNVHVYMDASNLGLCVLEPQRREFIRLQYTAAEMSAFHDSRYEQCINVRELQSAVLAVLL